MSYLSVCNDCGRTVRVDNECLLVLHSRYEDYPPTQEMCGASRTRDMNPPEGGVIEIAGGQWESNRRKH